jgi:hypothetical protein
MRFAQPKFMSLGEVLGVSGGASTQAEVAPRVSKPGDPCQWVCELTGSTNHANDSKASAEYADCVASYKTGIDKEGVRRMASNCLLEGQNCHMEDSGNTGCKAAANSSELPWLIGGAAVGGVLGVALAFVFRAGAPIKMIAGGGGAILGALAGKKINEAPAAGQSTGGTPAAQDSTVMRMLPGSALGPVFRTPVR